MSFPLIIVIAMLASAPKTLMVEFGAERLRILAGGSCQFELLPDTEVSLASSEPLQLVVERGDLYSDQYASGYISLNVSESNEFSIDRSVRKMASGKVHLLAARARFAKLALSSSDPEFLQATVSQCADP